MQVVMYPRIEDKLDSCILKIKTRIGVFPFEIIKEDGDFRVIMTQGNFELGSPHLMKKRLKAF
jgi:hypothetical protein